MLMIETPKYRNGNVDPKIRPIYNVTDHRRFDKTFFRRTEWSVITSILSLASGIHVIPTMNKKTLL